MIFVFGSNLAGIHGAGAAKHALDHEGAIWGNGWGRQGNSWAIPTKDEKIQTLPLTRIAVFVDCFLRAAGSDENLIYKVTRIGCGLAGFKQEQIAPLFKGAPRNCVLPRGWRTMNGEREDPRSDW